MLILQCSSDDDIADFRYLLRVWVRHHMSFRDNTQKYADIPFGSRYAAMAFYHHIPGPPMDDDITAALRPESDFDRQELALWLTDFLHGLHDFVR